MAFLRGLARRAIARPPSAPAPAQEPVAGPRLDDRTYERLYEAHARAYPDEGGVGAVGEDDLFGQLELGLLQIEGLRPDQTLVDFGCGNGRLAMRAVPYLAAGRYIGIDISETFLAVAADKVRGIVPTPTCEVSWIRQPGTRFLLPDASADWILAASVFTHMEHEDTYRYLVDARRVIRPGGRFVFTCLPLTLENARVIFEAEAAMDFGARWGRVRCVATSVDLMDALAEMSGWTVLHWYAGDAVILPSFTGELYSMGQAICVLEPRQS
jgi:SAM-dependent methyltransferase